MLKEVNNLFGKQIHPIYFGVRHGNSLKDVNNFFLLNAKCIESRALTLILFGCWADITKDIAEIRHAILSALVSCHVLEVRLVSFLAGHGSYS